MKIYKRNTEIYYVNTGARRISLKTKNKKTAEAIFEKMLATGEDLNTKKNNNFVFEDLINRYMESAKNLKSFYRLKSFIKTLMNFYGKNKKVDSFTAGDIEHLKKHILTEKGLSKTYFNRLFVILKIIVKKGEDWELVDKNVLPKLKKVKLEKETARIRFLSEDEIIKISKAKSYKGQSKNIILLALFTGMRKNEILSLKWRDIDFENKMINIRAENSKNGISRYLPIPEPIQNILLKIKEISKSEYVFYNKKTLNRLYDFKKPFNYILSQADIEDFHFHDLRHTFASYLVMSGAGIAEVQQLLGHKDIKMTMRYSNLSHKHLRDSISIFDNTEFQTEKEKVENIKEILMTLL